jgi:multidrug efflux pump subunit AcrA (membrane-fusion protein)
VKAAAIVDRTYKGVIRELSLAARQDEGSGWGATSKVEFPVRLEILDADKRISPGMTVVGDIIAEKRENVLILPHEYISRENDKYVVELESGEKRKIEVGMRNSEAFEIKSGLKEGDRVKQVDFASLVKE